MAGGQFSHQCRIQRFDKTHVGHSGIELFRCGQRRRHHAAERENGYLACALTADMALADRHCRHFLQHSRARAGAARVAHCARSIQGKGGVQHLAAFVFVRWRHYRHVGDAAQEGQIEGAGVGRAIGAYQAGAVDGEHHRQVLDRHIVDQLVVAALQEPVPAK